LAAGSGEVGAMSAKLVVGARDDERGRVEEYGIR
jgi:hypothetical protein